MTPRRIKPHISQNCIQPPVPFNAHPSSHCQVGKDKERKVAWGGGRGNVGTWGGGGGGGIIIS